MLMGIQMEEEKFSTVGGSEEPEKKGIKIKVITLLFIALIIIICILVSRTVILNKMREKDEKVASATVLYELNRIKNGDEEALEQYLNYSDIINEAEEDEEDEIKETESTNKNDENNKEDEDAENIEKIESSINDNELDEEDDKIFKLFLSTLDYEITDVNVEKDSATVTAKISNKDSGEIFRNYFTRAIKLAINQALSSNKGDEGKLESELQKYLEEQVVSSEIPTVTNEVVFNLEKGSDSWIIKNYDKDLTDVIFPNLINTIAELGEQYGEYGD